VTGIDAGKDPADAADPAAVLPLLPAPLDEQAATAVNATTVRAPVTALEVTRREFFGGNLVLL
jgi:uncharacterized protein (DUF2342 family)